MAGSATYVSPGETFEYTNAGAAIVAWQVVPYGNLIGVAADAIAASTGVGNLFRTGRFTLPAINTIAFVIGQPLFWDNSAFKLTNIPTDYYAGMCAEAKGSSGTTADILLGIPAVFGELPVADATIVVGAEDANVVLVTVQLKDILGNDITHKAMVEIFLSNSSVGDGLGTAPGGTVAIGTDGTIIASHTAKTHLWVQSEADGDIDFTLTETGTLTVYMVVVLPNGKMVVSDALTWAA